mmetsp:Transcript_68829/g.165219  ORF Transcript_68829/g.165219 Transcript_68829/m.165219 type:complete len:221 (+) Transcript_68829:101-763(+)
MARTSLLRRVASGFDSEPSSGHRSRSRSDPKLSAPFNEALSVSIWSDDDSNTYESEAPQASSPVEIGSPSARERLSRVAQKLGARIQPVNGDGNCQFRALSVVLYGHEGKHRLLRERVVDQLKSVPERYSPFVLDDYREYVERMECDKEWGDHITLQAASDLLGCTIQVLTDSPGLECIMVEPSQHGEGEAAMEAVRRTLRQPLCLAFITEIHYDAAFLP